MVEGWKGGREMGFTTEVRYEIRNSCPDFGTNNLRLSLVNEPRRLTSLLLGDLIGTTANDYS